MHEKLAKMDRLRANTDWLRQALFKVQRHLFIEQYYDGEGLEPSSDAIVETLLQEEPTFAPLPAYVGSDCAFYLRLNGEPMETLWEYQGQRGMYSVLLDRELPGLCVPRSIREPKPENRVDAYGNPKLIDRFITGIEEWINLGSPKITDYHIELINPAMSDDAASHSYIDRRPNATLRFSLLDVPISRDQNRPKS